MLTVSNNFRLDDNPNFREFRTGFHLSEQSRAARELVVENKCFKSSFDGLELGVFQLLFNEFCHLVNERRSVVSLVPLRNRLRHPTESK